MNLGRTKTLKARTNIHQSNINKFSKSLESKNLIKSIKSVKFPTRKIYMLSKLQPSIKLSGGPWYTDNDLDNEFITTLLRSIQQCLQDRYPPVSSSSQDPLKVLLYPNKDEEFCTTSNSI
ncbi:RNA polymerase Rpc34 subunit-domain-containing protein [Melampsora americana]|nr:RNA polymerase Rpc34 subunit-domain-containing protein [Melampsora americana]